MIVTYNEYTKDKHEFFTKHKNDYQLYTSPMDDYGVYYKTYCFSDGSIWYERMSSEFVSEDLEIKKCKVTVEVKMFRTEFWSTEASSKVYYEKF